MGIILGLVFLAYLFLAGIIIGLTAKFATSKKAVWLVVLFFVLFPFRRLIFYETLFAWYSRTPLQEIHETVESPESVYWEDNVWPGFDEYGRHWMVKNYLDGVHLKALALNGEDGRIYLYRATLDSFAESEKLRPEYEKRSQVIETLRQEAIEVGRSGGDNKQLWKIVREKTNASSNTLGKRYWDQKRSEIAAIIDNVDIYENEKALPSMNYLVEFNNLPKTLFVNNKLKMLHADRISITDTETGREIAYSKRYMAYAGIISQFSGQQPKFDYKLGDERVYEFDDKVLFGYAGVRGGLDRLKNLFRKSSYQLGALDWKKNLKKGEK